MAKPSIATDAPQGATLFTEYVGRRMKAYAVTEPEMDHVSFLNTLATGCFAATSFFAALIGGILTNSAFVMKDQVPPEGRVLTGYGIPLLIILSLLFLIGGLMAIRRKQSAWDKIKAESEPAAPKPSA